MGGCYSAMKPSHKSIPEKEKQPHSKSNTLTRNNDVKGKHDKKMEVNGKSSKKNQELPSPDVEQETGEVIGGVEEAQSSATPVVEQKLYNPFEVEAKTEDVQKESVAAQSTSQEISEDIQKESDIINAAAEIVEDTLMKSIQTECHAVVSNGDEHIEKRVISEVSSSPEVPQTQGEQIEISNKKVDAPKIDVGVSEVIEEPLITPHAEIQVDAYEHNSESQACNSTIHESEAAVSPAHISDLSSETEILIASTCQSFDLTLEDSQSEDAAHEESLPVESCQPVPSVEENASDSQPLLEEIIESARSALTEQHIPKEIQAESYAVAETTTEAQITDDLIAITDDLHKPRATELSGTDIPQTSANDVLSQEESLIEISPSTTCSVADQVPVCGNLDLMQGLVHTEVIAETSTDSSLDSHQQEAVQMASISVPLAEEQQALHNVESHEVCAEAVKIESTPSLEQDGPELVCSEENLKKAEAAEVVAESLQQYSDQLVKETVDDVLVELTPVVCQKELISEQTIAIDSEKSEHVDSTCQEPIAPESVDIQCQNVEDDEQSTLEITGALSKEQRDLWWSEGNSSEKYPQDLIAPELLSENQGADDVESLPPPPAPEDLLYSQNALQSECSMPSSQDSLPLPSPPESVQCEEAVGDLQLEKCCPPLEDIALPNVEQLENEMEEISSRAGTTDDAKVDLVADQHNPSVNQESAAKEA